MFSSKHGVNQTQVKLGVNPHFGGDAMHSELIEKAIKKYGSVRAVATALEVNRGNLSKAISAQKLSPQVAHVMACDLGEDEQIALYEALKYSARSDRERQYWAGELLKLLGVK